MFGEPRLCELLAEHAAMDIEELGQLIQEEVARWTESTELQDDFTLLLVRKTE
jgi:serine phosphatase RsbU (regulator of sigma subunit)